MNPFKVILAEALQGEETVPVVTAHSLSFQFQNNHAMSGMNEASNDLSEGNFRIGGKQTLVLANNTSVETSLPVFEIRLAELEVKLKQMKEGPEKVAEQAKYDRWDKVRNAVQSAIATALKEQYEADNPIV